MIIDFHTCNVRYTMKHQDVQSVFHTVYEHTYMIVHANEGMQIQMQTPESGQCGAVSKLCEE